MSNNVNDTIRERAREAAEECTNSVLGAQLDKAIMQDDLELMQSLTRAAERHFTYLETIKDSEVF
jgi:hypothetical protein